MHSRSPDRRRFLSGLLAAATLAACSGNDDDGAVSADGGGGDGDASDGPDAGAAIVGGASAARFFGPYYLAGAPARIPFGMTDDEGFIPADLLPETLTVTVRGPEADIVTEGLVATLYDEGLPRPYYAVTFEPSGPGFHDLLIDTPWGEVVTQAQVVPADDPVASAIVGPGDEMPAMETPTGVDARGVDPICTRTPPCDLHEQTVAEVVANGRPSVVLVATPAFCQTAVCGPVLDLLLEQVPDHDGVDFVHLEVYADPDQNQTPPAASDFAPAVAELGLAFEPVLYTVGADGIVQERLDYIFGSQEIADALGRVGE